MLASEFDELFAQHVVAAAVDIGFERWGKGLRWERDGLRVAILRTELRGTWPFQLTLVAGHAWLRDFRDRSPMPWTREPSQYPIKARPSEVGDLARRFRYRPWNLGTWPSDVMSDRDTVKQLARIGGEVAKHVPALPEVLTTAEMIIGIDRYGDDAWCERRWLADYRAHAASA